MQKNGVSNLISIANGITVKLREKIRCGHYPFGKKLPTERDLCRTFKASRGTVRKALDALEKERVISRQQGRGTFVVNPTHVRFESETPNLLGILVPEKEYYFESVLNSASAEAAKSGYILAAGSNGSGELESYHINAFLKNGIRGVIIVPMSIRSKANYLKLIHNRIPVVFMDTLIPDIQEDYVKIDDKYGTFLATQYLAGLGHKRITYLTHNAQYDFPTNTDRLEGFLEAHHKYGLEEHKNLIARVDFDNYDEDIIKVLKDKNRPSAIVCYNDSWAIKVIQLAKNSGLQIPENLSVIGFDDSMVAQNSVPPLTSIVPGKIEMGLKAIDFLIKKIEYPLQEHKQGLLICPKLKIRSSTTNAKIDHCY